MNQAMHARIPLSFHLKISIGALPVTDKRKVSEITYYNTSSIFLNKQTYLYTTEPQIT
jgi:hypothetical protein